jgi:hypothetical protein
MTQSDTEQKGANGIVATSAVNTRLTGSRLIIARVVWLALVIPSLGLFVVGLLASYQLIQRACGDPVVCNTLTGALTAKELQALSSSGVSASAYAALFTIFWAIFTSLWCAVGFLIFWRKSDDWLALLGAFFLVILGINSSANISYALVLAYPILALPSGLVDFLGYISLGAFFMLFPNGRLVPRWMGMILLFFIIFTFLSNFPSPSSPFTEYWPTWLSTLLAYLIPLGAIIFSQIYRYRRVSTPLQRQQTKWIVLGVTVALGLVIAFLLITALSSIGVSSNNLGGQIVANIIFPIVVVLVPLSIGFSILRYRLYDIDLLINRTLVYAMLTALLALVYIVLVIGLQSLVRLFTGQISESPVVIVASTLAIAALFQPLRHRIQAIIDRRFYRRKYDAAKTVETFSATLRNEVDLKQLHEHLITIVQETMQPSHVSLWLRRSENERKPNSLL